MWCIHTKILFIDFLDSEDRRQEVLKVEKAVSKRIQPSQRVRKIAHFGSEWPSEKAVCQVHPVFESHLPRVGICWKRCPPLLADVEDHLGIMSKIRQRLPQRLALVDKDMSGQKVQSVVFELRLTRWLSSWDRFESKRLWFNFRP